MTARETHLARCSNADCCSGTVITDFGMRFKCHRCNGSGLETREGPHPGVIHEREQEARIIALSAQLALRDVEIADLKEQLDRAAKQVADRDTYIQSIRAERGVR